MTKPTYWAIAAGLALAIVWIAIRKHEPLPAGPAPEKLQSGDVAVADSIKPGNPGTPTEPRKLSNTSSESPPTPTADGALPIDVTPGFEFLNTKTSSLKDTDPTKPLLLRHEELQAQARDPGWSEPMETALRKGIQDSLTARSFDTHRIELPVVECRATGCEIQAIGFREDIAKQGVGFQFIVAALLMGPLNSELDTPHGTMRRLPDGRVGYIYLVARRGS